MAKPNSQFSLKRTVARLPAACFPKNEQQTDKQTDREKDRQTDRQKNFKFQVSRNYFIVVNVGSFENEYRGTWAKTISGGKAKILAGFCKGNNNNKIVNNNNINNNNNDNDNNNNNDNK